VSEFAFDHRTSFESALGQSSNLSLEVGNKLNELDDIMLNPNIAEILSQDLTDLLMKPLDEKLHSLTAKYSKEVSELTREQSPGKAD